MTLAIIGIFVTMIGSMSIVVTLGRMTNPSDSRPSAATMMISNLALVLVGITIILTQTTSENHPYSPTALVVIISGLVVAVPAILASIALRRFHERN